MELALLIRQTVRCCCPRKQRYLDIRIVQRVYVCNVLSINANKYEKSAVSSKIENCCFVGLTLLTFFSKSRVIWSSSMVWEEGNQMRKGNIVHRVLPRPTAKAANSSIIKNDNGSGLHFELHIPSSSQY